MKIEIKDLINIKKVLESLSKLPDYRKIEEKIEYGQRDVLFGVLCSMFAGNSEMTDMHNWLDYNYNSRSFKVLIGREKEELKVPCYSILCSKRTKTIK